MAALGVVALSAQAAPAPVLTVGGMHGIVYPRGPLSNAAAAAPAGDMTWHNGAIMPTTEVHAIFWGKKWADTTFVADKITGLDSYYQGVGGSHYATASDEYTGTNGTVTSATTYDGHIVDTSPAPKHAPKTSTVLAEVAKMITNPVANGYYPVYVDTARGGAGFCAYHSYGTINGVPVQFAFFFNLDGDAGCDPQDTSGLHSQGLAALANVSGHEYSEARTDPRGEGWYDSNGAENGDKCAWSFGAPLVTFSNGSQWKIQGEWSNAVFDGTYGGADIKYTNTSGQLGCLAGVS